MIQKMFLFKSHLIELWYMQYRAEIWEPRTTSVVPNISVTKVQINFMVDYHHKMQLASVSDTKHRLKSFFLFAVGVRIDMGLLMHKVIKIWTDLLLFMEDTLFAVK